MNLDLRPDDRLLIAEGDNGRLRLSVHKLHLHRVGLYRLVAFGHVLGLRGHRGFFGGDGHISAAEFRAVFIHIGYVHLRNAAQLHKVAHNVADLFLLALKIADVVPLLAVHIHLTMDGHWRFLAQRADNVGNILAALRRSAEVDGALFRHGITGHIVQGRVSAVGFGAGLGRFLWLGAAGISIVTGAAGITGISRVARIAGIAGIPSVTGVAGIPGIPAVPRAAAVAGISSGGADGLHDKNNVPGNRAVIIHRYRLGRGVGHLITGDLPLPLRAELIYAGSHIVAGIVQQCLPVLRNVINMNRSVHRRGLGKLLGGQIHIAAACIVGFFLVAVKLHQRHGLRRVHRRYILLGNRGSMVAVPIKIGHIIEVGTSVRHSHGDLQGPRGAVHGLGPIIGDPVLPHRQLPHGAAGQAVGVRVAHVNRRHVRRFRGQRPQRGRQLQKNQQQTGQ